MITKVEERLCANKRINLNVSSGRKELDWSTKSVIIYFHLHPALGNKDLLKSSQVFSVNPKTLEGWMTKTSMKIKWADMVGDLNFDDVVDSIPKYSSSLKKMM